MSVHDYKILIVDDEIDYQEVFKIILSDKGYYVDSVGSAAEALKRLHEDRFNLVLTDVMMAGINGTELLEKIKCNYKDIEVILVTGYGTIENAVAAMKKGASSYFIKSHDPEALLIEIEKLAKLYQLELENKLLKNQQRNNTFLLQTNNTKFKKILDIAEKAAISTTSILITGESGVGKEVIARYIHDSSNRKNGHFIAVNCQAFSENLLESELFGHEKGAFTGALDKRIGRFEESHNGTLFLDEIGEVPLSTQVKLLRVLETKSIERIGSNKQVNVNLRLISATNKNLIEAIRKGCFREDLLYRINTIVIEIPSLRERKEDLPELIDFFLDKFQKEQKKKIVNLEKGVKEFLLYYNYPGNVRELKNIIERLVVLSEDGIIRTRDLPETNRVDLNEEIPTDDIKPLKEITKEAEAIYIEKALKKFNGNITETAKHLYLSRRQLFNKLVEYNIR